MPLNVSIVNRAMSMCKMKATAITLGDTVVARLESLMDFNAFPVMVYVSDAPKMTSATNVSPILT